MSGEANDARVAILPGIQILRGLAALAVVLHHALEEAGGARVGPRSPDWLVTAGAAGVDLFFVISGFIMLHVAFGGGRTPPKPGRFLLRRVLRIYPLYWVCCAGFLLLGAVGFMRSQNFAPDILIRSALLLPTDPMLITVAWTLVFEMVFYVLFAASLVCRSAIVSLIGTTLAILVVIAAAPLLPDADSRSLLANPIAIEFCLGLLIAWTVLKSGQAWPAAPWAAVPALAVILAAPAVVPHQDSGGLDGIARILAWGVPAAIIVATSLGLRPRPGRATRWGLLLGDASYAIYLTHLFVMMAYARLLKTTALGDLPQPAIVAVVVLAAATLGTATHLLVERPLQSVLHRAGARRQAAVAG